MEPPTSCQSARISYLIIELKQLPKEGSCIVGDIALLYPCLGEVDGFRIMFKVILQDVQLLWKEPHVSQIARRAVQTSIETTDAPDLLPAKRHSSDGIFVESQLMLGIEPKLHLSWAVVPRYWHEGYTLLVFHSMSGFCPERYPDDLNRHGQLIIETRRDDWRDVRPSEGTHFYTFLLHKKSLFGLREYVSVLRLSETIPSAHVALGRIKDKLQLEEMRRRHELEGIEHEARLHEAEIRRIRSRAKLALSQEPQSHKRGGIIDEELASIDAMVEAVIAAEKKIQELKRDPKFKRLSQEKRAAILQHIEARLDPGEISAQEERRGS
jgi:hypothetical protein